MKSGVPVGEGAVATVPVLWVDDDERLMGMYCRRIEQERSAIGLKVDVAYTIDQANQMIESKRYGAVIADLQMDRFDFSQNGAEFLTRVHSENKSLPAFVVSAYLDDPRYQSFLEKFRPLTIASKAEGFDPPFSESEFFRTLQTQASGYYEVSNKFPERIEFGQYMSNPDRFDSDVGAHWQKHGLWIEAEMVLNGFSWCVVCGQRLVAGSPKIDELPSDAELEKIGQDYNLIPFMYGGVRLPEEIETGAGIDWHHTSFEDDDYYPTLCVRVEGKKIADDFDTGAPQTHVSAVLVRRGPLDFFRSYTGTHLGLKFDFYTKRVELGLEGAGGRVMTKSVPINVVKRWAETGFVLVNADRICLFGRDLLRAFPARIELDSTLRRTTVAFVDDESSDAAGR